MKRNYKENINTMEREIIKINEDTYRVEDGFVRFFILVGKDKAAVIDSGVSGAGVVELIRTITDKELILVNTHGDGDHCAGTFEFSEISISREDYYNCGLKERFPDCRPVFISEGNVIDLGGRTLEIIETPGHTKGSLSVLDRDNKALFSGDGVQTGNIFMFGQHRDTSVFESSLNKLIARKEEYEVIYPSHDTPILKSDYVEKVLIDWKEYLNGNLAEEEVNIHGNLVKCYKGKSCGFLIQN